MNFDTNTPRRDVTISGATFQIPAPFAEGHTVTAGEASALNQILSENARNNLAKEFKTALDGGAAQADLQAKLDEYVAGYEFGVRNGRGPVDPIMTEAKRIATSALSDHYKRNGKSFSKLESEDRDRLVAAAIERNPSILDEARRIVKARKKVVERSLDFGE